MEVAEHASPEFLDGGAWPAVAERTGEEGTSDDSLQTQRRPAEQALEQESVDAGDDLFGEGRDDDLFGEEDDELEVSRQKPPDALSPTDPTADAQPDEAAAKGEEALAREEDAFSRFDEGGRRHSDDEEQCEDDQEIELPLQELPPSTKDARLVVLRLPPTVSVKVRGAPATSRRHSSSSAAISADDKFTIEWGYPGGKKDGDHDAAEDKALASNCKLVEWDDGSYSLFVDRQMFDVQVKRDPTLFFENSSSETIKTLHCRAESRFQVRLGELLNFREFFTQRNMRHGKKRRAALTTQEQIERAEQLTRKTVERRHEAARTRRRQADSARGAERGLTRHFLEADSEEELGAKQDEDEEDGSSLAKIKEQYKRQKRFK
ncbi:UNVERIFIED_CONTAM: Paf1/RNA polymerase II complex component LEO1 [Hammondia hammondi]|eukprot:XP_008886413.1 Paf1/RNA polymerase II complex component LEO1 [Hammondia hammondi]